MKKIENTIKINASPEKVWQVLTDEKYYLQWYEAFGTGSKAITDWKQDSKIIFTDDNGMGLIGQIAVFNPPKELRFEMKGMLVNGKEDYDSPEARGVQLAGEHYVLEATGETTILRASADMDEAWYDMMSSAWDVAKEKIKELAENN